MRRLNSGHAYLNLGSWSDKTARSGDSKPEKNRWTKKHSLPNILICRWSTKCALIDRPHLIGCLALCLNNTSSSTSFVDEIVCSSACLPPYLWATTTQQQKLRKTTTKTARKNEKEFLSGEHIGLGGSDEERGEKLRWMKYRLTDAVDVCCTMKYWIQQRRPLRDTPHITEHRWETLKTYEHTERCLCRPGNPKPAFLDAFGFKKKTRKWMIRMQISIKTLSVCHRFVSTSVSVYYCLYL